MKVAQRHVDFCNGTGRYERPKRAYRQPAEHVSTIKRQSDAIQTMRRSRDSWRARAQDAENALARVAETMEGLVQLAVVSENNGIAFAAKKVVEALRG